jgi:hypothetical protein
MPLPISLRERLAELRRLWPSLAGALALRCVAYAAMTALALYAELRPAPTLPDLLLARLPYVRWIDQANYLAWLVLYVPLSGTLLVTEPERWRRYMVTGSLLSIARGACIALTGLGPPDPVHMRSGVAGHAVADVYLDLISPLGVFQRNTAHAYLTKDLFFSGHTSTTFLLALYLWHRPGLRYAALVAHAVVVATVLLSHIHYSIDVAGAYAFTFAAYAAREWRPAEASHRPSVAPDDAGSGTP